MPAKRAAAGRDAPAATGAAAKAASTGAAPAKAATTKRSATEAGASKRRAANGAATKGAAAKGAAAKGAAAKGAATKGAAAKGAATKGAATKGAATKGAATKGAATKGAATKGAATKSAVTKGAATKSTTTRGVAAKGAATEGAGESHAAARAEASTAAPVAPPAPPRPVRPLALAARLAALDDAQLAELLRARPDALRPPRARSFERLASTLGSPHSILAALADADQLLVGVAVALMYLGGAPTPDDLLAVLPEDLPLEVLESTLDRLDALALLQRTADGRVHPVSGLAQVVQMPKGFGPPLRNLLAALQLTQLRVLHLQLVAELGFEGRLPEGTAKQALLEAVAEVLGDPDRVIALVRAGPPGTDELVARLARNGPALETHRPALMRSGSHHAITDPREWCVEHGLVIPASWGLAMMPREVAAAIRGGRALDTVRWRAPDVRTAPLPEHGSLGEVAGHAAASLLERVGRVVGDLEHTPLPALKTGGVGARAIKPLAKSLGVEEHEAAFLVDLATAAGLVAAIRVLDPALDELSPAERKRRLRHYTTSEITVIVQTDTFDRWKRLTPAARWTHLVDAWLTSRRWLELAGRRDADDKLIPAIDMTPREGDAPKIRRAILDALLRLPTGERPIDLAFVELLEWEQSMTWSRAPAGLVDTSSLVGEAMQVLGLAVSGALSPLGAVLAEGLAPVEGESHDPEARRRALVDAASGVLPALTREFTLQADLTAMAAGPLAPEVITGLTALAEVESRGAASVFRFTEASLRSAFDNGRTADDILAFLEAHADRGVPQPLRYLVTDTERRHGSMRVGTAKSYIRSDDAAVMAELVKTRKVAKLGLRLLAPTVAVCDQPIAKVLTAVRGAGFLPAQEDADGALVTKRPASPTALVTGAGAVVPRGMRAANGFAGFDEDDDLFDDLFADELTDDGSGHADRDAAPGDPSPGPGDDLAELAAIGAAFHGRGGAASPIDMDEVVASLRAEAAERAASPRPPSRTDAHRGRVPDEVLDRIDRVFTGAAPEDDDERRARDRAMQDAFDWLERQQRRGR